MKHVLGSGRKYLIIEINLKNWEEFVLTRPFLILFMFFVVIVVNYCSYFMIFFWYLSSKFHQDSYLIKSTVFFMHFTYTAQGWLFYLVIFHSIFFNFAFGSFWLLTQMQTNFIFIHFLSTFCQLSACVAFQKVWSFLLPVNFIWNCR